MMKFPPQRREALSDWPSTRDRLLQGQLTTGVSPRLLSGHTSVMSRSVRFGKGIVVLSGGHPSKRVGGNEREKRMEEREE